MSETTVAPRSMPSRVRAVAGAPLSPWVRSAAWDGAWMLSAVWLVPLVLWLARGRSDTAWSPLDTIYFVLTALFWIGHRLGSAWLAYCTEAYRPLLKSNPVRFAVLPLLMTIACFGVLLPPDAALPWPRAERLVALAILDYAFVTYHFAAQHFGALSLYRMRAGRSRDVRARRMDRMFALGIGGLLVFAADVMAGAVDYQEMWIGRLISPAWLASAQAGIREGAALILIAATAAMLVSEFRAERPSWPRALYVAGLAAMVAVGLSPHSLFPFLVIWTSQHWILATGLASLTPGRERAPLRGALRKVLHRVNTRPWMLLLLLMLVSVLFLPLFEVEANRQGGIYYGDRIFGALATGLRTSSWVPALLALGFSTGFLHYLLDRNVYRFSDPGVRSAARGVIVPP